MTFISRYNIGILLFCSSAHASPLARNGALNLIKRQGVLDCSTDYSSDYYGFGVRIGIYFAWLSAYFANTLLPPEISGSLDTNCIFLLALLLTLFHGTVSGQLMKIDGLIIMHLASGFLFSSLSVWGYRTLYYQQHGPRATKFFGGWGTHIRLVLVAAISIYGTWFWWKGIIDGLDDSSDPRCSTIYTWLFHTWTVGNGIHVYYIIVSLGCAIYFCFMCCVAVAAWLTKTFRRGLMRRMRMRTGLNETELKWIYIIFRGFNIFWIIFCIVTIELTINENHILKTMSRDSQQITLPGQLVPLFVGVFSLVRVLWLILKDWRSSSKKTSRNRDQITPKSDQNRLFTLIPQVQHFSKRSKTEIRQFDNDRTNPSVIDHVTERSMVMRYVFAWLPWLAELLHPPSIYDNNQSNYQGNNQETNQNLDDDDQESKNNHGNMAITETDTNSVTRT